MPLVLQYALIKNDTLLILLLNIYILCFIANYFSAIYIIPHSAKFNYALVIFFFFHATFLKLVSFTFQLFHVKIQEVLYMDDNRKSVRTSLSADLCDLSAVKTTPWWEEANLLVSKARRGMEKYQSA